MANGFRGSVLLLWLLLAVPVAAAETDERMAELVPVLNRVAEIGTGEAEQDRAVAGLACRTLGDIVGDPLQSLLGNAYPVLRAAYDGATPFLGDQERYADLLDWLNDDLEEAGMSSDALAALRERLERLHDPGVRGMVASYAIELHVSEITTAVCFTDRRLERGDPLSPERIRTVTDSAVLALQALAVIAVANTTELGLRRAPSSIAAAATALGGIAAAGAYGGLH